MEQAESPVHQHRRSCRLTALAVLLALPAAAVLSVLVRFAYQRYLKEHPDVQAEIEAE